MATKKELLDEFTEAGLRELADKHNVDFTSEDLDADEMREELASSAVTKAEIESYSAQVDRQEGAAPPESGGTDPALANDVDEQVKAAAEGTSTDAASRVAGTSVEDVEAAPNEGDKPTDEEGYDFPPAGDVEILTADAGDGEGEKLAPLEVEDWVVLGEHELVPDRLVGRRAVVLEAPRGMIDPDKADDTWITVRTRDEVNAKLVIPLSAVDEVQKGGRDMAQRG